MSRDDDAGILFPDRTVTLGDETVTAHELSFLEGMQLAAELAPLIRAVGEQLEPLEGGEIRDPARVLGVFGDFPESAKRLMVCSTRKPMAWIRGLKPREGHLVLLVVWMTNQDFFFPVSDRTSGRKTERLGTMVTALMALGLPAPPDLFRRFTRRQIHLFYREAQRRECRHRADLLAAAAIGARGKDPAKSLRRLRDAEERLSR